MPRSLSGPFTTALTANNVQLHLLVQLTFSTGTVYAWTGVGNLVYSGNTYLGVGSLGQCGEVKESIDVTMADGLKLQLSGLDSTLFADSRDDIQVGASAIVYLALFSGGSLVDTCKIFGGIMSDSECTAGPGAGTISLNLENKMLNGQRSNNRRYTSADQNLYYPGDTFFAWVESLQDTANLWKP